MEFHIRRRQQFLSEEYFSAYQNSIVKGVHLLKTNIPANESEASGRALAFGLAAKKTADLFLLRYTAGESLDVLRADLPVVIDAYEKATAYLRAHEQDDDSSPLMFGDIEEYERAMQLVGLCYLFHRTELLPRLSALFDGLFAGEDNFYEDLLSFEMDQRYEVDVLIHRKPYLHLLNSLNREKSDDSIHDLEQYLKAWYSSMKNATWHDSHLTLTSRGPGYFGYWAIEAAAIVFLHEIDDSSFRDHIVYPKDLADFARALDEQGPNTPILDTTLLRVEGGQPCPHAGYWTTPAQLDSRRLFKAGEIMPTFEHSAYGATIWQWSEEQ